MQRIPEQITPTVSQEERIAMAYRYAMTVGENRAAHTCETDFYVSPGIWTNGEPSRAVIRTEALRTQRIARGGI